jgi:transposase
MAKHPRSPTLWHVPDPLWPRIESIIDGAESKRKIRGRPAADRRLVLDGIIFRLRTGCQWKHLPPIYGSDTTIHRYFQLWTRTGVFEKIWALLLEKSPGLAEFWNPSQESRTERP